MKQRCFLEEVPFVCLNFWLNFQLFKMQYSIPIPIPKIERTHPFASNSFNQKRKYNSLIGHYLRYPERAITFTNNNFLIHVFFVRKKFIRK